MNKLEINNLKKLLSKKKNIVILTHKNPDGDAMGSSLGLYNFLKNLPADKQGKKHSADVITPNDYPDFLHWLPGNKNVVNFEKEKLKAVKLIDKAEIIFCLDFNTLKRIEEVGMVAAKSPAIKILIDHHPEPENIFDFMLHDVKACSTAELVFEFISLFGGKKNIDKNISNCLYTGIMTDTNNFSITTTSARTHAITAELIKCGAQNSVAYQNIYNTYTESRLRLIGHSLAEKMKIFPEHSASYISLSADELEKFHYRKGDTEGLVNFPLSIDGIKFSAFFIERDGTIKISFRSQGKFDVNKFARMHFDGGGHRNAAGGQSDTSLEIALNKFVSLLPSYKKELADS